MPISRISLPAVLMLVVCALTFNAKADELKDIAQQSSQGQSAAALDRINAYVIANPNDVQGLFLKGVILAEQNRRDEAIKVFSDLTDKYPSLPEPYNNLAVLYADQGEYDKARKALEAAIKTHPSYATAHENLGDIYARMASQAYDKALQLDNSNTRAQTKLSLIKDLFSSSDKPVMVASKTPVADSGSKAAAKPAVPATAVTKPADTGKIGDTATTAAPAKTDTVKSAETGKSPSATPVMDDQDVGAAVHAWAKAWSSKNITKYLASYTDTFQPPNGESRKEWQDTRRERIDKPVDITVEILNIRIKMTGASEAKVSFKQSYRAGSLAKRTSKTLVMKKVSGKWLIDQELTDR